MRAPRLWSMHGLVVRSDEVDLDARRAPADAPVDVTFRVGTPRPALATGAPATGDVLARLDIGQGAALTVVEVPDTATDAVTRYDVHFHGYARVEIDAGLADAQLVVDPAAVVDLAPVLFAGTVMSVLLALRGHPVLHASAVRVETPDGIGVIAFIGGSGRGKSTMATLACRDGALLFADDVLRTDVAADGTVLAWPGATATRLRAQAFDLGREATDRVEETADGRLSASMALAPDVPSPLLALVVPSPDRETEQLVVERITGVQAMLTIASFPRVLGWTDVVTSAQAHHHWGALARAVPVLTARVPWGPPFAVGLGTEIVQAVLRTVAPS